MKKFLGFIAALGGAWILNGCGTAPVKNHPVAIMNWEDRQNREFNPITETTVTETGVQLYLKGDLLFNPGKTKMNQLGIEKIDAIAAVLLKHPEDKVAILGFTDSSGNSQRNLKLSQQRAGMVKAELVKQGVNLDNLTANGMGDSDAVATNDSPEGRAQNRRVEMDITN